MRIQSLATAAVAMLLVVLAAGIAYLAHAIATPPGPAATAPDGHAHASLVAIQLLVFGAFLAGSMALVAIYLTGAVVGPLERVSERLERVSRGAFGERLPPEGAAQVGRVALAFNAAAQRLAQREERLLHEERIRTIRLLLTGVAHEINNPLTFVQLNERRLLASLRQGDLDPALVERLASRNVEGLARLARLSALLLEVSGDRAGERDLHAVDELAQGSLIMAQSRLIRHNVDVALASAARVLVNATDMCYVLSLLLTNAAQASLKNASIRVASRAEGRLVVVEVSDDGPPIPPPFRPFVFSAFSARASGQPGLGIAREIVEQHGGTLTFGQDGPLTVFTVRLPAAASGPASG